MTPTSCDQVPERQAQPAQGLSARPFQRDASAGPRRISPVRSWRSSLPQGCYGYDHDKDRSER